MLKISMIWRFKHFVIFCRVKKLYYLAFGKILSFPFAYTSCICCFCCSSHEFCKILNVHMPYKTNNKTCNGNVKTSKRSESYSWSAKLPIHLQKCTRNTKLLYGSGAEARLLIFNVKYWCKNLSKTSPFKGLVYNGGWKLRLEIEWCICNYVPYIK